MRKLIFFISFAIGFCAWGNPVICNKVVTNLSDAGRAIASKKLSPDPQANKFFTFEKQSVFSTLENVKDLFKMKSNSNVSTCGQVNTALASDGENLDLKMLLNVCRSQASLVCDGTNYGTASIYNVVDKSGAKRCLSKMPAHLFYAEKNRTVTSQDGSQSKEKYYQYKEPKSCSFFSSYNNMIPEMPGNRINGVYTRGDTAIRAEPAALISNFVPIRGEMYRKYPPSNLNSSRDDYVYEITNPDQCKDVPTYDLEQMKNSDKIDSTCDFISVGTINNVKFVDWNRASDMAAAGYSATPPSFSNSSKSPFLYHNFVTFKGTSGFEIYKFCPGDDGPVPLAMSTAMILNGIANPATGYDKSNLINDPNSIMGIGMSSFTIINEYLERTPIKPPIPGS